jgi:hypothetical protein
MFCNINSPYIKIQYIYKQLHKEMSTFLTITHFYAKSAVYKSV